jgi:hypothetical protein
MPLFNPIVPSFTLATRPTTYPTGQKVFLSNVGTKGSHWYYDSARWKPEGGLARLSSLDAASSAINASETIIHQYQMPAALWQVGDHVNVKIMGTKSGTTNTGAFYVRIGTLGTTSDQGLYSSSVMTSSQRHCAVEYDIILLTATSALIVTRNDLGYGGSTTNSPPSSTTISNVSNALYVNVAISGGATDTVTATNVIINYMSGAN